VIKYEKEARRSGKQKIIILTLNYKTDSVFFLFGISLLREIHDKSVEVIAVRKLVNSSAFTL
jgi:hypothetical protein